MAGGSFGKHRLPQVRRISSYEKMKEDFSSKRKAIFSRWNMVSYTHKRPLCGHCASPLQKPSQSVCAYGLTSWGFMVNYTYKRPLCGNCMPPLHEKANRSAPFGLDLLDFHGRIDSVD